jgi:hypothetical protein
MWKSIREWAKKNKILAATFVILSLVAILSAADGISMRQTAKGYLNRAQEWAQAYQRDTAASKAEYEGKIKTLTADRDAYRKKYEAAKGKMNAPWVPPSNAQALQDRLNKIGYRGRLQ